MTITACLPVAASPVPVLTPTSPPPDISTILYITYDLHETAFRITQLPLNTLTPRSLGTFSSPPGKQRWFITPSPDFSSIALSAEAQNRLLLVAPGDSHQREVSLSAPPGSVLWSPDGQKILAGGAIWDVEGNLLRTMPSGVFVDCAWAQDGLALACSRRDVQTGKLQDVWVMPVDDAPYRLTADAERGAHPVFSPNGQKIAYFRLPDNTLVVRNRNGLAPSEIYPPYPLFIRDKKTLIASSLLGSMGGIWFDAAKTGPGNLNVNGPLSWSPDGNQIAFDCDALCITDLAANKTRAYRENRQTGYMADITWSPDGTHLTFALTSMTAPNRNFIVHAGSLTGISLDDDMRAIAWSPDSTRLVFSTAAGLYLIHADGSGQTLLAEEPSIYWLVWKP